MLAVLSAESLYLKYGLGITWYGETVLRTGMTAMDDTSGIKQGILSCGNFIIPNCGKLYTGVVGSLFFQDKRLFFKSGETGRFKKSVCPIADTVKNNKATERQIAFIIIIYLKLTEFSKLSNLFKGIY